MPGPPAGLANGGRDGGVNLACGSLGVKRGCIGAAGSETNRTFDDRPPAPCPAVMGHAFAPRPETASQSGNALPLLKGALEDPYPGEPGDPREGQVRETHPTGASRWASESVSRGIGLGGIDRTLTSRISVLRYGSSPSP
jgi:hypothetical protein